MTRTQGLEASLTNLKIIITTTKCHNGRRVTARDLWVTLDLEQNCQRTCYWASPPLLSSAPLTLSPHEMSSLDILSYVDWSKQSLWLSVGAIVFNPTAWNIVARNGASRRALAAGHPSDFPSSVQSTETRRLHGYSAEMRVMERISLP